MRAAATVHQVRLELEEPIPSELLVGSDIVLRIKTTCTGGCDLSGRLVVLMSGEDTLVSSVHGELAASVPVATGTHAWTLLFARQEVAGLLHERASLPISFRTVPVPTSLAVWDVPTPVVGGERLTVKVGAKSALSCSLAGALVECLDEGGAVAGRAQLGDAPWPGTTALYWAEVELVAPAVEGVVSWSARVAGCPTELPHANGRAQFSFAAVGRPDCRLTIRLVEKDTARPIEHAHVRLGPFRACTDAAGIAELSMPRGTYEVTVWHAGYEADPVGVEINDDVQLDLIGVSVPDEDPSARFMM